VVVRNISHRNSGFLRIPFQQAVVPLQVEKLLYQLFFQGAFEILVVLQPPAARAGEFPLLSKFSGPFCSPIGIG